MEEIITKSGEQEPLQSSIRPVKPSHDKVFPRLLLGFSIFECLMTAMIVFILIPNLTTLANTLHIASGAKQAYIFSSLNFILVAMQVAAAIVLYKRQKRNQPMSDQIIAAVIILLIIGLALSMRLIGYSTNAIMTPLYHL